MNDLDWEAEHLRFMTVAYYYSALASRCQPWFLVFRLTARSLVSKLPRCHEDCESSSKAPFTT